MRRRPFVFLVLMALLAPARAGAAWIRSWETGAAGPYPYATLGPSQYAFPRDEAIDQTMRMIVHLSAGGKRLRVHFTNVAGRNPVTFDGLRVARRSSGPAVDPASSRSLTFGGASSLTIPAGEEAISDPVDLATETGQDLAITFHVVGESGPMTWHGSAFAFTYTSGQRAGNVGGDMSGHAMPIPLQSWFFVDGVDIAGGAATSTVVGFGDSLTDGFVTAPDRNDRYTDLLGPRLGPAFSVVNAGISGNSISRARNAETDPYAGPPGVDRFDRDVLDVAGVRTVIVFEGTNDLSVDAPVSVIQDALTEVTERAHAAGVCVIGATLTPRSDGILPYSWNAGVYEPRRVELNNWMRSSAAPFDALADLDLALRDPLNERELRPAYNAGDGVHFSTAGRQAVADTIPTDVIRGCATPPPPPCRHRVVVRLPPDLRHVQIRVGRTWRRVAPGTRRVVLRPAAGTVTVRVRARRASGAAYARTRRVRICATTLRP
ncbi:MAG: hypothetical protein QOF76_4655 [Solirubrobacteraceae bacterium]|nr:hypothetical protein [Solirubrobacteraceae bacterium]